MSKTMREVTKLVGPHNGPTSVVMVGVHGNEPCGINAVEELLPVIKIQYGTVFFIVGNPNAVAANVRFTEFNLNRAFKADSMINDIEKKSYEYHRAQYLKLYLDQASTLLDIHSSFTPGSVPFVICEENAISIVRKFPVGIVTSGFDRVNPGGTDEYMNRNGKTGICIECGEHTDPQAKNIAKKAIYSFLNSCGHIASPVKFSSTYQRRIFVESIYHSKTDNFELSKDWGDFEKIPKGSIVGVDGGEPIIVKNDSIVLFARNCKQVEQEAFYLGTEMLIPVGQSSVLGPYCDWPVHGH